MPRGITDDQRFPADHDELRERHVEGAGPRVLRFGLIASDDDLPVVEHQRHRRSIGADRLGGHLSDIVDRRVPRAIQESGIAHRRKSIRVGQRRVKDRSEYVVVGDEPIGQRPDLRGAESDGYCDQSPGSSISALFVRPGIRPTRCGHVA